MNGTFIRLQAEFTDTSIPKLYRDKLITAGTKYVFDSQDTYSYEKQATPTPGVDVWRNLLDSGANATFSGAVGFVKGFTLAAAVSDYINMPNSGIAAPTSDGFVSIIWFKLGTPSETGGSAVINAGSGYSATTNQYAMTWSNKDLRFHVGGWQRTAFAAGTWQPNDIHQFAMSMKKRQSDGKYELVTYIDGQVSGSTSISPFTKIPQPDAGYPVPQVGSGPSYQAVGWGGEVYRVAYDDTSVKSAAEIVALDYAENHVRIRGV